MKFFLGLSIILNLVLIYFLVNKKPEKEIVERLIIETHPEKSPVRVAPGPEITPPPKKKEIPHHIPDVEDFQEAGEKTESDRKEFVTEKLGLTEEKWEKHQKLRDEHFKQVARVYNSNQNMEPSFAERRRLIDMEEDLYKKIEKLYGKKNWERYKKYRQEYNERGYKRQMEENQPFIFMGL